MDTTELWSILVKREIVFGWMPIIITILLPFVSFLLVTIVRKYIDDNVAVLIVVIAIFALVASVMISITQGIPRIVSPEIYAFEAMKRLTP